MKTLLTIAFAMLTGCGGQAEPMRVFNQPTDRVIPVTGYASQIQQQHSTDPVEIVAKQAALPGNVMLYVGHKEDAGIVERFPQIIAEAKKYPGKFSHVYSAQFAIKFFSQVRIELPKVKVNALLAGCGSVIVATN
jgi:hypothetical protein